MYGLMEAQFKKYMEKALKTKGNTANKFFSLLETRLDNVIFRLGFVQTRPQARQLVSHRHVFVNGNKVNIPSYEVKIGDTITLGAKVMNMPGMKKLLEDKEKKIPSWLVRRGPAGKIVKIPVREDVVEPISDQDIIEFYSR